MTQQRARNGCKSSLGEGLAYRRVYTSNDTRTAALAPWLEHYNTERAHSALGGLTPLARLLPTS